MIRNPFFSIWKQPRETIRSLVETDPTSCVIMLAGVAGIVRAVDRAAVMQLGLQFSPGKILVMITVLGFLGGLLNLWGFSLLLKWTGRWLGGTATLDQLRAAFAWSSVPCLIMLPLWGMLIGFVGSDLFTTDLARLAERPDLAGEVFAITLFAVTLGIWSLGLFCQMVAEVQGFKSAWRGFLNVALVAILFVVVLLVLSAFAIRP